MIIGSEELLEMLPEKYEKRLSYDIPSPMEKRKYYMAYYYCKKYQCAYRFLPDKIKRKVEQEFR